MVVKRYFTEHPASVGETYGQHFRVATRFAIELAVAAVAAAVHAVVPSLCASTASSKVRGLHDQMTVGLRGETDTDSAVHEVAHPQPVA